MNCTHCGQENREKAGFCRRCGKSLVDGIIAPPIRHELPRRPLPLVSRVMLLVLFAGASLVIAGYGWYGTSVRLALFTTPAGADVTLDGRPLGTTDDSTGELDAGSLKRGAHVVTCAKDGFERTTQTVDFGFFSRSRTINVNLPVKTFAVSVLTAPPGSSVLVDGKPAGMTDHSGALNLSVSEGRHIIAVSHDGYPTLTQALEVNDNSSFTFDLAAAGEQEQQQISESLERAKSLFEGQQYDAALAQCNSILALDPSYQAALTLKQQIVGTEAILNGK